MKTIDLMPPERLTQRLVYRRTTTWVRRSVGLMILLLLVEAALVVETRRLGGRVNELRADHARLQERLQKAESMIAERDRLSERQALIVALEQGRTASGYLEAASDALPPASYLRFFGIVSQRVPGQEEVSPETRILLKGVAESHAEVGAIIGGLRASPRLGRVTLVDSKDETNERGDRRVSFEMSCEAKVVTGG